MMPPKCYTWLESCGSQLSDGQKDKLFVLILQSIGFSMTLRTDIFLYTEKLSYLEKWKSALTECSWEMMDEDWVLSSVVSYLSSLLRLYFKPKQMKLMSNETFVCGNKQSVFSARHNSLLARAHSIFRHCLIGWWVLQAFLHLIKAGQGIGYISSSFVHTTGEKRKTFTGNFSRLAHVFKLGVFCDTFREWRIGVESLYAADLRKTRFIVSSCNKCFLRGIKTFTYRAATGEIMSCK